MPGPLSPRTANRIATALTIAAVVLAAFGFASVLSDGPYTKVWGVALVSVGLAITTLRSHGKQAVDTAR